MHGGSEFAVQVAQGFEGLSPHARGKLAVALGVYVIVGSIPACTGEAIGATMYGVRLRVYPRMHGGSGKAGVTERAYAGLSPHARGKHRV